MFTTLSLLTSGRIERCFEIGMDSAQCTDIIDTAANHPFGGQLQTDNRNCRILGGGHNRKIDCRPADLHPGGVHSINSQIAGIHRPGKGAYHRCVIIRGNRIAHGQFPAGKGHGQHLFHIELQGVGLHIQIDHLSPGSNGGVVFGEIGIGAEDDSASVSHQKKRILGHID